MDVLDLPADATPYAMDPSVLTTTTAEVSRERIENTKRERRLYGEMYEDVKFLRSRDFKVNFGLCVDGKERTPEQVHEIAERERRLMPFKPKQKVA